MTQSYWSEPEDHINPPWIDEADEEEDEDEPWESEEDE